MSGISKTTLLRVQAIEYLGGKCVNPKCLVSGGCKDIRALQIDHVNGGGNIERRNMSSKKMYRRILKGEPGYQVLCANCNWIKMAENKENSPYIRVVWEDMYDLITRKKIGQIKTTFVGLRQKVVSKFLYEYIIDPEEKKIIRVNNMVSTELLET